MNPINPVRPSPIAGSWYSADRNKLSQEIKGYLNDARPPVLKGWLVGLIAPHAGYFYSGQTAGYAYAAVAGMHFDTCVVASPLHDYMPNPLLTSAHEAYTTPLGRVEIAQDLLTEYSNQLAVKSVTALQPISNDREHSLEIQLPFLQTALAGSFQLLPLMVRSNDPRLLQACADALAEILRGKNVLLVASTDLSHFYDESTANALDGVMLKRMTDFSPVGVLQAEVNQEGFACGSGAVALILWTAKALGADTVTLLHHSTSAKSSGDTSSVVGYGALAITRQEAV